MTDSLTRVLTLHQTSLGSTRLPLELQQVVYSFLDARSFWAARNVCKWWRFASLDSVTLARQLRKLPILPPVDAAKNSPQELQNLFNEAADTLMLGMRVQRQKDDGGNMTEAQRMGFMPSPRVTATSNGKRTVTINNRQIALFDTSGSAPRLLMQRPLNDLKETVGNGPWLKVTPNPYHDLVLSSDGNMLAIAQERTIQIYDLSAEPDSFTVNEYITSAAGHYICGLDFEQDDHVLRVRLSGKGSVLYLGTPPSTGSERDVKADIEHWKSKAGLRHVFLDSSLLTLPSPQGQHGSTSPGSAFRLSGLQLLRPYYSGYLFAAQRHGGNESSHYILGHVNCSSPTLTTASLPAKVEADTVAILARLESFLSAWDYTLNGVNDSGMGLWENMPSAHEHHPSFALSPDSRTLVLAERDKKRIRPVPIAQVFVYRLPGEKRMMKVLENEEERKRRSGWASLDSFLNKLEQRGEQRAAGKRIGELDTTSDEVRKRHSVGRLPLCLSTVQGAVTNLKFEDVEIEVDGRKMVRLTASTAEATKSWTLTDM